MSVYRDSRLARGILAVHCGEDVNMAHMCIEYGDEHGEGATRWGNVTAGQLDAVLAFAVSLVGQPDTEVG
jgi:hypothetical protein